MSVQAVLVDGKWRASRDSETFSVSNPATGEKLPGTYPVSPWDEVEEAILAAARAAEAVRSWPGERFAMFLDRFAERLEARKGELVATAHAETALAASPRLSDVELPRTISQLRQAAAAAREGSWRLATIDKASNIRSQFEALGPVAVFGPNNFPFAFNGVAGGDFAAAVAAGNPVIAKGHSSHPTTSRILAEEAHGAAVDTEMPAGFVQMIYRTSHADGAKLVSHPLMGATGYTGAREAGLFLKDAADKAGKPIYLELSSINPIFILPGALEERLEALAEEFATSCLMGTGQFCTNPGLVVLIEGPTAREFVAAIAERFQKAKPGVMLNAGVVKSFLADVNTLKQAGAELVTGGDAAAGPACSCQNTLLKVDGDTFLARPEQLQTEAFGNGSLIVIARNEDQLIEIAKSLEGNLTGCVYSHTGTPDNALYLGVAEVLRRRVGRLLNDKMPTGVAVVSSMNHGGPYPATGHPGFTAVGIPASLRRFAMLACYDNVRQHRLPPTLQDQNPNGRTWRLIDGVWTQGNV